MGAGADGGLEPEGDGAMPIPSLLAKLEGEVSAGHPRPCFHFESTPEATELRVRIDGGAWETLAPTATRWQVSGDLDEGEHIFEIAARDVHDVWSDPAAFVTTIEYFEQPGFFHGVERAITTTPHGHLCAISAHNCYSESGAGPAENVELTRLMIEAARLGGADFIELDIRDEGSLVTVGHNDGTAGRAPLADVLDAGGFETGDEVLFLEIKETAPTIAFARAILDALAERRDHLARNGRPVVLRAFHDLRQNLLHVATALEEARYDFIRPYIRLSELFNTNTVTGVAAFEDLVDQSAADGFDMVELNYRTQGLHTLLAYARDLGLAANVWTIPTAAGEVYIASLREAADVLTVDYPVAEARDVVEDDTSVLYLSAEGVTDALATSIPYFDASYEARQATIGVAGRPSVAVGAAGEPLFGGFLRFERAESELLPLVQTDAEPERGFLLSLVIRLRSLSIGDGETRSLLASTEVGGFTLELHDPVGETAAVLRYGVRVGGEDVYATYPLASLSTTRGYAITGAYDGSSGVYLWVDYRSGTSTSASASGVVQGSALPITLGADPQSATTARYFADIDVQVANVQRWVKH
jgi:hypothetical protein